MRTRYIHYGNSKFDLNKFVDVSNNINTLCDGRKPCSGLWGTNIKSENGWKELILSDPETSEKDKWRISKCFTFEIKESANILFIKDENDFNNLLKPYFTYWKFDFSSIPVFKFSIDWIRLASDFDGIETLSGSNEILKSLFYGWECDSICVFHANVLIIV